MRSRRRWALLLKDVKLLAERVGDLRTHFERTSKDIGEIEKPMGRIAARASPHRAGRSCAAGDGAVAFKTVLNSQIARRFKRSLIASEATRWRPATGNFDGTASRPSAAASVRKPFWQPRRAPVQTHPASQPVAARRPRELLCRTINLR